jgi:hypothetical protein
VSTTPTLTMNGVTMEMTAPRTKPEHPGCAIFNIAVIYSERKVTLPSSENMTEFARKYLGEEYHELRRAKSGRAENCTFRVKAGVTPEARAHFLIAVFMDMQKGK